MSAVNTAIRGTMPIEKLRQEPCFVRLTARQKLLIETYVASAGDTVFSVMSAYDVKDQETARKMSYEIFAKPSIIQVLNLFFGVTPFEAFKRDVERAVRNKKLSIAQVRALELHSRVNGFISANVPNSHGAVPVANASAEPKHFVDEIVRQNGNRFKVTAVDPNNGKITAVEPIL